MTTNNTNAASTKRCELDIQEYRDGFSRRLKKACDINKIPPHNRVSRLSSITDVTVSAVRKWLSAKGLPELPTIIDIAMALGVDLEWLVSDRGTPRNSSSTINEDLLSEILETIQIVQSETGRELSNKEFAYVIAKLYSHFRKKTYTPNDSKTVTLFLVNDIASGVSNGD